MVLLRSRIHGLDKTCSSPSQVSTVCVVNTALPCRSVLSVWSTQLSLAGHYSLCGQHSSPSLACTLCVVNTPLPHWSVLIVWSTQPSLTGQYSLCGQHSPPSLVSTLCVVSTALPRWPVLSVNTALPCWSVLTVWSTLLSHAGQYSLCGQHSSPSLVSTFCVWSAQLSLAIITEDSCSFINNNNRRLLFLYTQ